MRGIWGQHFDTCHERPVVQLLEERKDRLCESRKLCFKQTKIRLVSCRSEIYQTATKGQPINVVQPCCRKVGLLRADRTLVGMSTDGNFLQGKYKVQIYFKKEMAVSAQSQGRFLVPK